VCERGDAECSQRKRRLAREEIDKFKADPGGAAGVANDETIVTAGVLLEQALMGALMDLLDRVDGREDGGRTATGVEHEPWFFRLLPAFSQLFQNSRYCILETYKTLFV